MLTAAMRSARDVLNLTQLYVICHGVGSPWQLSEGITAVPAGSIAAALGSNEPP
jgi:hypothetical protein